MAHLHAKLGDHPLGDSALAAARGTHDERLVVGGRAGRKRPSSERRAPRSK